MSQRRQFTSTERASVYIEARGLCARCGRWASWESFEVDHVKPLAAGGSHWPPNWQCLCRDCHRFKTRDENTRRG